MLNYRPAFAVILFLLLTSCGAFFNQPYEQERARIGETSPVTSKLEAFPLPQNPVVAGVYNFKDQTGQYKPQANVSSFSTAVTQGGTSILMQALSDSDWFLPVEREGLQNVLTERKITRAANQANKATEHIELPPLTTAKILLEGGIISYDSNTKTGGFGAEYFGIGASELYREDQITVYLRAVDVRTGQVLVSVSTNKKVLSQELRAGLFRYVSFKRLAEIEGGFSENEPMHVCVQQAIEKAITELVMKGIERKVWRAET